MATDKIASLCVEDLITKLKTVDGVNENLWVYNQNDLIFNTSGLQLPAVGVVYIGMQKQGAQKEGRSQQLICDIYLFIGSLCEVHASGGPGVAADLLDDIRKVILKDCVASPTGHPWSFQFEAPAGFRNSTGDDQDEKLIYVQRWATRANLG